MTHSDADTIADGKWLRSVGAIRPMAVAAETVYVIGEWNAANGGCYPLLFTNRLPVKISGLMLFVYGVAVRSDATRGDVRDLARVLRIPIANKANE